MSVDTVYRENKAKVDIGWDGLIEDAKQQIAEAQRRIVKLRECIHFFKRQKSEGNTKRATQN